jgi:hypothetical protein
MLEQNTLMFNITLFENELKWQSYIPILFNGRDGGGCAYEGITERMTLQIDKHVRIRNLIKWEC